MIGKIDLKPASSLLEAQLSERSGFVRDFKSAETIIEEYEIASTTKFAWYN